MNVVLLLSRFSARDDSIEMMMISPLLAAAIVFSTFSFDVPAANMQMHAC